MSPTKGIGSKEPLRHSSYSTPAKRPKAAILESDDEPLIPTSRNSTSTPKRRKVPRSHHEEASSASQTPSSKAIKSKAVKLSQASTTDDPDDETSSRTSTPATDTAQNHTFNRFWSEEDQVVLDATSSFELSLWKRCARLFNGLTPFELMEGFRIALTCGPLKNKKGEKSVRNINWPNSLCNKLASVICCPALQDRNLLLYAIKVAMHCRSKDFPPPDMSLLRSERNNAVIKQIQRQLEHADFPRAEKQKLISLLNETKGAHRPAHSTFVDYIATVVNSQGHQRGRGARNDDDTIPGVRGRDIDAVSKAWDIYAAKAEPASGLETIAEYHMTESKLRKGMSKEQVKDRKKKAIIEQREKTRNQAGSINFCTDDGQVSVLDGVDQQHMDVGENCASEEGNMVNYGGDGDESPSYDGGAAVDALPWDETLPESFQEIVDYCIAQEEQHESSQHLRREAQPSDQTGLAKSPTNHTARPGTEAPTAPAAQVESTGRLLLPSSPAASSFAVQPSSLPTPASTNADLNTTNTNTNDSEPKYPSKFAELLAEAKEKRRMAALDISQVC